MENHKVRVSRCPSRVSRSAGFSLVELMVALGVFLVIGGAAFSLVTKHLPVFTSQQNQAGLNFGLRNAAAQLQIDGANAGSGFYNGVDIPGWPIGITVESGSGDGCHAPGTQEYHDACFDRLNVIRIDPSTPPAVISNGGHNTATSSILTVQPWNPSVSISDLASHFKENDLVLVLKNDGTKMTATRLSKAGQAAGNKVQLQHNSTAADGTNSTVDDIYQLTTTSNNKLQTEFDDGDWVLRLAPSVYTVDATDPTNPKLAKLNPDDSDCSPRKSDGAVNAAPFDSKCIIAEQIIGFKVGAQLVDEPNATADADDCNPFCYDSLNAYGNDWSRIRGIRATLIARTPPGIGSESYNTFDKGHYKIEAISVVVYPRSLSIHDVETTKE